MPYVYKFNKKYKGCVLTGDPTDFYCAGCAERCEIFVRLHVSSGFNDVDGFQSFLVVPVMYAGNVRLYKPVMFYGSVQMHGGGDVSKQYTEAKTTYKEALFYCQKTCKHRKLR